VTPAQGSRNRGVPGAAVSPLCHPSVPPVLLIPSARSGSAPSRSPLGAGSPSPREGSSKSSSKWQSGDGTGCHAGPTVQPHRRAIFELRWPEPSGVGGCHRGDTAPAQPYVHPAQPRRAGIDVHVAVGHWGHRGWPRETCWGPGATVTC